MFTSKDVTVYIPCNGEDTLCRCLDGLLSQTAVPAKILLLDNCCECHVTADDFIFERAQCPVEVIRLKEKIVLAGVRNKALELCATPLVASLDPDTMPSPDWLEMMVESIEPKCHCLAEKKDKVCGIGGKTGFLVPVENPDGYTDEYPLNWGDCALDNPRFIWSSNSIFKVGALKDAGGYLEGNKIPEEILAEKLYANDRIILYMPSIKCAKC